MSSGGMKGAVTELSWLVAQSEGWIIVSGGLDFTFTAWGKQDQGSTVTVFVGFPECDCLPILSLILFSESLIGLRGH